MSVQSGIVVLAFAVVMAVVAVLLPPIALLVATGWILFGVAGYLIGVPKGHDAAGFVLGLFLGPIGLLVVAVMEPTEAVRSRREELAASSIASALQTTGGPRSSERVCPWCAETIKAAARLCRYCGQQVDPVA